MIRSSYWILNIRCWYCPSHSFPFNCKKQQLVFYVRARLKVVFCRPLVHRQHRWPWQPPGRYVADTHLAATSSGIEGSPEHAASGKARRITQYSHHGHQIRSIRPVTLVGGPVEKTWFFQMAPIPRLSIQSCSIRCQYDILKVSLKKKDQNLPVGCTEHGNFPH